MAAPKKPSRKTQPETPYDKKLLTAWKNIGEKALRSRAASLSEVWNKPGCWEAMTAAIDQEKLSLGALWYLGQTTVDALPARFAPGLLRALPEGMAGLWWLHSLAGLVVLRQMLEAPETLTPFLDDPRLGEVVEIAALVAGQRPHGSGSERLVASIETDWSAGQVEPAVTAVVDGVAVRPARDDTEAMRRFAEALIGRDRLREALARGHRARLDIPIQSTGMRVYPLYVRGPVFALAAEALTPEEVAGFQPVLEDLTKITATWTVDALVRAANAAATNGRPDGYMVALSMATLAIARDPEAAPRVVAALDLSDLTNQATPGVGQMVETLLRTPPAWRRTFAAERLIEKTQVPSTFAGPVGLVLLASVDPPEAERRAHKHRRNLDGTRLNGTRPELLLPLLSAEFPFTRGVLSLPVLEGLARSIDRAPPEADDLVEFDGSYRDSWICGYLVALPRDRGRAVVAREKAAGRFKHLRKAVLSVYGDDVLRDLEGATASA